MRTFMDKHVSGDRLRPFDGIVRTLRVDGARAGPLAGTTFVAKDLYDVRGYRTGAGNPDWERTHAAATATAPAIERLSARGRRSPENPAPMSWPSASTASTCTTARH